MNPSALQRLLTALKASHYQFVTTSPASHRRVNNREGNQTAADLRGIFGWNRPFQADVIAPEMLTLMREADILSEQGGLYKSQLRVASLDGQLYFHSSYPTDEADAVFFGPDTYIYAQVLRTELAAISAYPGYRAVDIGCGAGPGAVLVAAQLPQAEVWGTDINPKALELARVNVAVSGLHNVRIRHSNLLHDLDGRFDLIVSNPPFMMDDEQRTYCHGGGELGEGLSLDIVRCALERLKPGGRLVLYTCIAIIDGADPFRARVAEMAGRAGAEWTYREIDPDVYGSELNGAEHQQTDRIAAVALSVTAPA